MHLVSLLILLCWAVCTEAHAQQPQPESKVQPDGWVHEQKLCGKATGKDCAALLRGEEIQDKVVLDRYERLKGLFPSSTTEWQIVESIFPDPPLMFGLDRKEERSSQIVRTYKDKNGFEISLSYEPVVGPTSRDGFEKLSKGEPGTLVDPLGFESRCPGAARCTYSATVLNRPALLNVFGGTPYTESLLLVFNHMEVAIQFMATGALTADEMKQRLAAFATSINYAALETLPPLPNDLP